MRPLFLALLLPFSCIFMACDSRQIDKPPSSQQTESHPSPTVPIKSFDYGKIPKFSLGDSEWQRSNISLQVPSHYVYRPSVSKTGDTVKAWIAEIDSQYSSKRSVYRIVEYTSDFSKYREIRYLKFIAGWSQYTDQIHDNPKWNYFNNDSNIIDIEEGAAVRSILNEINKQ